MGRKSIKENKNIYQISRENMEYSRALASEKLQYISADRIEKIESEKTLPHPDEVLAMAECYKIHLSVIITALTNVRLEKNMFLK